MTVIRLHGILKHEFGEAFCMSITKAKEVVDAISVNHPTFKMRLLALAKEGIHYSVIVDGEVVQSIDELGMPRTPNLIDLVPTICGHGVVAAGVVAVGAFSAAAAVGVGSAFFASFVSLGIAALGMAVQMALAPKPDMGRTESTISGAKQSFMLSSKANLITQGNPVPVGYGRLRIGSSVIQTTIKSYPQRLKTEDAMIGDNNSKNIATSLKDQ